LVIITTKKIPLVIHSWRNYME